jgi:Ca-activated chloride channel family protein
VNWQFQYPQFLWALTAIPLFLLLYLVYLLWRKRTVKKIGDPRLVKELYKEYSPLKSALKFALFLIAFALGCIAIAHPRQPDYSTAEARKGIDIMIALDVSNSMLADDIVPNRLENAKRLIYSLMRRLPDDRIGLVLFAGNAYVRMPLTFDRNAAEVVVSAAAPSAFKTQGTAIGDALEKSELAFQQDSKRFKAIILITDGETHDANVLEKANELLQKGIMINTVGIGSPGGTSIKDTISGGVKRDLNGAVVVSKLNEEILMQLAALTKGQYVLFSNAKESTDVLAAHLSQIEKVAVADASSLTYTSFYWWVVLPMLLLILIEIFIPDKKKVVA